MSILNDSNSNDKSAKEIKELYRIEAVIGEKVSLKKSGKNLVGLCPFHKEKTPSFTVHPDTQSFKCYGCEIGGDLINFLMEFDKKSFLEVIKDLSGATRSRAKGFKSNIDFPKKSKSKSISPVVEPVVEPVVTPVVEPVVEPVPTSEKESSPTINLLLNDNFEDFPKIEPVSDEAWTKLLSSDSSKIIPRDRKKVSQIIYKYSDYQEVWRFEWSTPTKTKPDKTFKYRNYSFDTRSPKWIWAKGSDVDYVWAYRLDELNQKIETLEDKENLYILHVEGEKSVEIARSSGISAFSLRGTREEKLKALNTIQKSIGIIHIIDNDEAGRKHALELGELCEEVGLKFTAIETSSLCPELTDVKGADIEEILNLICPGSFIAKISEILSVPTLSSESNTLSVSANGNSPVPTLSSESDAGTGGNPPMATASRPYNPDEVEGNPDDIFRLEVLAYSDEVDPFRKMRLKGEISARYRISNKELQELVDFTKGRTTATKAQRHTGADFLKLETEGIKWLIPGIIPGRGVTILGGAPGAGKTTIAYDMAASILYQEPFLGEDISKPGKVLFVSSDEQPCFAQDKLINRGYTFDEQWQFVTDWDISQKEELELYISDFLPQFVMIDSFAAIHRDVNFDENSSSAKAAVYWLESLANKYGCAIVLIHHCNKNKEQKGVSKLRGNTAIAGACSAVLLLEGDNNVKSFSAAKLRGSEPFKWDIKLDADTGRWSVVQGKQDDSDCKSVGERILNLFITQYPTARLEVSEIENEIGGERSTLYKALDRLCKRGLIVKRPSEVNRRFKVYGLPLLNLNDEQITLDLPSPPTVPVPDTLLTSEKLILQNLQTLDTTLDTHSTTLDNQNPTNSETLMNNTTQTLDTNVLDRGERGGSHQVSNINSISENSELTDIKNETESPNDLVNEEALMSEENIECFAGMLRDCDNAKTLDLVRSLVVNRDQRSRLLNESVKRLPKVVQQRISRWIKELNDLANGQSKLG
jgi:CHC2 zinc finger/AAA domain